MRHMLYFGDTLANRWLSYQKTREIDDNAKLGTSLLDIRENVYRISPAVDDS